MVKRTKVKRQTIERYYSFYNQLQSKNLNAEDLIDLDRKEFKERLGIKKLSIQYYQALKRILLSLPDKEDNIYKYHKQKVFSILGHRVGTREEEGFRIDFRERVSITKEGETYYSAHYRGSDNSERHIFAPNLKRLKEILAQLESVYHTKYKKESQQILKYTAFVDRTIQTELQQYIIE